MFFTFYSCSERYFCIVVPFKYGYAGPTRLPWYLVCCACLLLDYFHLQNFPSTIFSITNHTMNSSITFAKTTTFFMTHKTELSLTLLTKSTKTHIQFLASFPKPFLMRTNTQTRRREPREEDLRGTPEYSVDNMMSAESAVGKQLINV